MPIKSVKMEISKKNVFLSHVPRITQPKNQVPRSIDVLCSPLTDGPIIKDRPNKNKQTNKNT